LFNRAALLSQYSLISSDGRAIWQRIFGSGGSFGLSWTPKKSAFLTPPSKQEGAPKPPEARRLGEGVFERGWLRMRCGCGPVLFRALPSDFGAGIFARVGIGHTAPGYRPWANDLAGAGGSGRALNVYRIFREIFLHPMAIEVHQSMIALEDRWVIPGGCTNAGAFSHFFGSPGPWFQANGKKPGGRALACRRAVMADLAAISS